MTCLVRGPAATTSTGPSAPRLERALRRRGNRPATNLPLLANSRTDNAVTSTNAETQLRAQEPVTVSDPW